jgi:hypothetical protein
VFDICEAIALQKNDFASAQDCERYSGDLMGQHLLLDEAIDFYFCRAIIPDFLLTEARNGDY